MPRCATILIGIVACLCGSLAQADDVQIRVDSQDAYLDVPFLVAVDVTAKTAHNEPVFPELDGADAVLVNTNTSSSSSFSITINGRQVNQARNTTSYVYQITPHKTGPLRIPAVEVNVDGDMQYTRPLLLRVTKSDAGDLLFVELDSEKSTVYVGEAVDLTLYIWVQPFVGGGVRLSADDMWRLVDRGATDWGPFGDNVGEGDTVVRYHNDRRVGSDGKTNTYYVYEVSKRVWAERPGPLAAGDIRVVINYPVRISRDDSPFAMLRGPRITQARPIVGVIDESPITVKPIPTQGRPPTYRGAVGKHAIDASAAPTEAQVGDPITLTLIVRGPGRMESLQAPPLAEIPAFTHDFQVADDPLPGVVSGNAKRFTQSLRALSPEVTEIPPVPFVYFDPSTERFVTATSQPIPLKITPAERMSSTQIVQATSGADRSSDVLTRSVSGIEANYTDASALLAQQGQLPTTSLAAVAGACPVAYAACALLLRRRRKLISNTALRRRRYARRSALRALDAAQGDANRSADALLGYVADRFDLPAGGLTRQEAVQQLRRCGAPADLIGQIDNLLADCETAQFGGGASVMLADLPKRIRTSIEALARNGT